MSKNNPKAEVKSAKKFLILAVCIFTFSFASACRYDMQDQPRYKPYKQSDWFSDKRASRDLPEGTVARGYLCEDKAFYQGKKDLPAGAQMPAAQTATDAAGNTVITSFPDAVDEFPVPVTKELIDRGEQRYKIYCIVCHGPVGNGDGMIVRRGFSKPPTYNDDRLRNAPVGHFFDVMTNGFGKMNPYASQISVADRWAIVAYIRTLQISQNPNGQMKPMTSSTQESANANAAVPTATPKSAANTSSGGAK